MGPILALQGNDCACVPSCIPRCRRAHTAALASRLQDTSAAGSTVRPRWLTAGRPAPAHLTVGCPARGARAHTHSSTARAFVAFMQLNASKFFSGPRHAHQCMHHKKGTCSRIVHCIRFNVATAGLSGPFTAAQGRALSNCSCWDTLGHGGMRHPGVPQRVRECDHGRERIVHRVQFVPCRPSPSTTQPGSGTTAAAFH